MPKKSLTKGDSAGDAFQMYEDGSSVNPYMARPMRGFRGRDGIFTSPSGSLSGANSPEPNPELMKLLYLFGVGVQDNNDPLKGLFGSGEPPPPPPTVQHYQKKEPAPVPTPTTPAPQGTPESFTQLLAALLGGSRG